MGKKLAVDYYHPENNVAVSDPTLFGRNYFERSSAPEVEDIERDQSLADAAALKKLAIDYGHPENNVTTSDPTLFGRNYFDRPCTPEVEDDERDLIFADVANLKKLAVDYSHPENKVSASDPTLFGRNYFDRVSAPQDDSEKAEILADALVLKEKAINYSHPEKPIKVSDPTVFGRNYYHAPRASADTDYFITSEKAEESMSRRESVQDYYLDEAHDTFFDFDHDDGVFTKKRQSLYLNPNGDMSCADFMHLKDCVKDDTQNEEEYCLSRSPSCVILFGLTH